MEIGSQSLSRAVTQATECAEKVVGRAQEGDSFGGAVSPREDQRDESSGFSGGEVDGGVSDVGHFVRFESPVADDFQGGGGIGLFWETFAMALNGGEEVRGEERFHDFEGEGVGLVGKNGKREFFGLEFPEKVHHSGVAGRSFLPVLLVVFLKTRHDLFAKGCILFAEGSLYQSSHAISDKSADFSFRVVGEPGLGEGAVECEGDAREGVDKGAIKVENECADHSLAISRLHGISNPCFDRVPGIRQ